MPIELYNKNGHLNIMFSDLVTGDGVQANQFLIASDNHAAILDPGGELTYSRLFIAVTKYVPIKELDYILASHQDPDIIASIHRWLVGSKAQLVCPEVWQRFIPHFARTGKTANRIMPIPDIGMNINFGKNHIKAIPAHFLHSEGNFQFYDPISKILFSGDMGANLGLLSDKPFTKLAEAIPTMEGFHRRYMNCNKACRLWANMVRNLDIEWLVPQHGRPFKGRKVISQFLDWIEKLECGIDLMTQKDYQIPRA